MSLTLSTLIFLLSSISLDIDRRGSLNLRNSDAWLFNACAISCLVLNTFSISLVLCNSSINKSLKYCSLAAYGKELSALSIFLLLIDINSCFFIFSHHKE